MEAANAFADRIYRTFTKAVNEKPKITDFMSPNEYKDIQRELMLRYGVLTPNNMKALSLQFTYTVNSYVLLIGVPREDLLSGVDIYKIHTLPVFKDGKTFFPARVPQFFANTINGEQLVTPLTPSEARDCITNTVCEAAAPTRPIAQATCGLALQHDHDPCTYVQSGPYEPHFIVVDVSIYYALIENATITLEIECQGGQQRSLIRQKLELANRYGNVTLNPGCVARYGDTILAPAHRKLHQVQHGSQVVAADHPGQETSRSRNVTLAEIISLQPDVFPTTAKILLAITLTIILIIGVICIAGKCCPMFAIHLLSKYDFGFSHSRSEYADFDEGPIVMLPQPTTTR